MFINPLTEYEMQHSSKHQPNTGHVLASTVHLYWHARSKSLIYKLWSVLTRRSSRMRELADVTAGSVVQGRHSLGVLPIPLHKIRGSENRHADFDNHFHPTQERTRSRWMGIATAAALGTTLPPIEVIQVGDEYFVRDGHHRVSVARMMGQYDIDAQVVVWEVVPPAVAPARNACVTFPPA
jgi:hypothetical protein